MDNFLLMTDSYKASHHKQYPPNTTTVFSYFESRGGMFDEVVFFGLQCIIKKYLLGKVVTEEKIQEAKELWSLHFSDESIFNEEGWRHILNEHDGHLPLIIRAVPEGTVVPTKNVLFTVENTDPKCFWLTGWVETLLVQVWYPCTVATNSRENKKIIKQYLDETADNADGLPFKLHDFGFRGVSSVESAGLGGMAHLVNFLGSDTMMAVVYARKYYGEKIAGFSIPASEHSTITSWGEEREKEAMRNMLEQFPKGLVACVSDSYNIWDAISEIWGGELKQNIIQRDGTLVVRPDSGEPTKIVVKCLKLLEKSFGAEKNSKGYKVLPPQIRLIQGDGIDLEMIKDILSAMKKNKWSADNIAFGSGGSLLQKLHRDTMQFAFKCSSVIVDGEEREVFKNPITDPGKKSKRGRLSLVNSKDGILKTMQHGEGKSDSNLLQVVFKDGNLLVDQSFADVRKAAELS
eukprot:m.47669 g.47669  ORF g.47669 m.47669 type:complete len:461 (+) comp7349_c0_seq1:84-1466(+)